MGMTQEDTGEYPQSVLLLFKDEMLEARFGRYHNKLMASVDLTWVIFATVLIPVTALGKWSSGQPAHIRDWARLIVIPLCGIILQKFAPKFWLRYL